MYLVDTLVWIHYLKERESEAVARFVDVLDLDLPFGITGVICGEVLQGAKTTADFEKLKEHMSTQRFYDLRDPIVGYEEAARLCYRCRGRGITVRSTIDRLISRVAIEHDLALLHDDGDFASIGRVVDELKLA